MKRTLLLVLVAALVIGAFGGCASNTQPAASSAAPAASSAAVASSAAPAASSAAPAASSAAAPAKKVTIGLSMDALDSGFWIANLDGMRAEAKKQGADLVEVMADGDANKQNDQIKQLIAQSVSAIIIAPKDGSAIVSVIKEAQAAKIPVIMNNRPVQGTEVVPELSILSDNYTMAYEQVKWFGEKAKAENKTYNIMLLVGNLGDENAVERQKGHKAAIEAYKDNLKLVQEVPTEWKADVCLTGVQNAMKSHPEIDCIIAPSDSQIAPIKSALEQISRWNKIGEKDHVTLLTFDGDGDGMQAMKDGYSTSDAAQAAVGTGEQCIQWAVKLANGEKPADPVYKDPGIIATTDNFDQVKEKIWGWSLVK